MKRHATIAPTVSVELDKPRTLLYDFLALELISNELGIKRIAGLGPQFWADMGVTTAITVIWAGLRHESPEITVDEVRQLLRGLDPAPIIEKTMEAWGISRPAPKEGDEENPPKPETSPNGSNSGVSPDTISA